MANIKDKVILLHTSGDTSTNDAKNSAVLTGNTFSQGEIAIITKTDDESLLIKNQGGNIVEFPAKGKINKAISDAIDVSVSGDTGVINTKIEQAITSANTYTNTQITKVTVKNADKSINVSPSDSGTTISVNVKSGDNALKLDNGGLYVDQSALTSYEGKEAILIADKSGVTGVKEIALKINANDKILSQTADGLLSTLSLAKVVSPATGMASQYQLVGKDGTTVLGVTIDIPKDQFLKSAEFIASATEADKSINASIVIGDPYLKFVFQTTGTDTTTYISVKKLVDIYVAGNGINITSNTVSVKIDASGEAFLTVGTGGLKLSGVQTAINTAVTTEKNRAEGIENSLRTDVDSKVSGITASDASITVDNTTTTNPKLKVTLSQTDGNRLALNADGLYVTNIIDCDTF